MRTMAWRTVCILGGLALAFILTAHPSAQTPKLRDAVVLKSIPAPDALRGLTFADGHLWGIDGRKNVLLQIDPTDGRVVSSQSLDAVRKARGLASDGKAFWFIDSDGRALKHLDPATGKVQKSIARELKAGYPSGMGSTPRTEVGQRDTLQALAWDGKYLWGANETTSRGGFLLRFDVADGETVGATPAPGLPLGLASDGTWLWEAVYDSGHGRALLVRWKVPDAGTTVAKYYRNTELGSTRAVVARLPGKQPAALAWDGEALWYADRKQKTISRLQLPTAQ